MAMADDLAQQAVIQRLLRVQPEIALGVLFDPLDGLAGFVQTAGHLHAGGDRLDLRFVEADAREVAVVHQLHRMAVAADLLIDLEAALGRGPVEGTERAVEAPALLGRLHRLMPLGAGLRDQRLGGEAGAEGAAGAAGAGGLSPAALTAAEIRELIEG